MAPRSVLTAVLGLAAAASAAPPYPPVNKSTVARAQAAILAAFDLPAEGTYGAYCNPCPFGDAVGILVRLPFHDAVGGGRPDKKGGPNGCIDWTTADNNGLKDAVTTLTGTYTAGGFDSLLSFADFIVLAGNAAVRVASTLPPGTQPQGGLPVPDALPLELPFRYGRADDATCDGVDAAFLPTPDMSYSKVAAIFCGRVGMTPRQLVAIMGAHTLGRAESENSGFDGSWSGFSGSFSIMFYRQLLGAQWNSKDAPTNGWLAAPPSPGDPTDQALLMIKSSDVEMVIAPSDDCPLFNELNLTKPTPTPQPGVKCPLNALNTATLKEFSTNQTSWWEVFSEAWQVMTEHSYKGLLPVVS